MSVFICAVFLLSLLATAASEVPIEVEGSAELVGFPVGSSEAEGSNEVVGSIEVEGSNEVGAPSEVVGSTEKGGSQVIIQEEAPIGHVFNIHATDLLSTSLPTEGIQITEGFPKECIIQTPKDASKSDDAYFASTKSIYADVGTRATLEPEIRQNYALKHSLDALTNSISASEKGGSVSGYALRYQYLTLQKSISKDCLNKIEFSNDFLESLERLNVKIDRPRYKTDWYAYGKLLKMYGSHMIVSVNYGSSISQYAFSLSSKHYSEKDLRVRACGKFNELGGNVNVLACNGITQEDKDRAYQLDINTKIVIRGGSKATRASLMYRRSKELIEKFKEEARSAASPVEYSFVPIWEILKVKYFGTPDYAKANNLEEYYKGMLNFGCEYLEIDGKEMQMFEKAPQSPKDQPSYQCKLRDQGCLTDQDCHYSPFECNCYGSSCIEHREEKNGDGTIRRVPFAWREKRSVSRGCAYNWSLPPKCVCETKAGFLITWYNQKKNKE